MDLQELHFEIAKYDSSLEESQQQWEKIRQLKPKEILDNMLISDFNKNEALQCKELIYRGANKQYLYDCVSKIDGGNLTMIQDWLLQDLYNIRKQSIFHIYMIEKFQT